MDFLRKEWIAAQIHKIANNIYTPPIKWRDSEPYMHMLEDIDEYSSGDNGIGIIFNRNNRHYAINLISKCSFHAFDRRETDMISAHSVNSQNVKEIWTKEDSSLALSLLEPWSKGDFPENSNAVSEELIGLAGDANMLLSRGFYDSDEAYEKSMVKFQKQQNLVQHVASQIICEALDEDRITNSELCIANRSSFNKPIEWHKQLKEVAEVRGYEL